MSFKSAQSGPDFDVASGRVLDRYQLAAAWLARRYFGEVLRLDPFEPVRPPRAGMFLRLLEPGIEAGARGPWSRPVLVFHLDRRIDHAGNVSGAGQHEADRSAEELRA